MIPDNTRGNVTNPIHEIDIVGALGMLDYEKLETPSVEYTKR